MCGASGCIIVTQEAAWTLITAQGCDTPFPSGLSRDLHLLVALSLSDLTALLLIIRPSLPGGGWFSELFGDSYVNDLCQGAGNRAERRPSASCRPSAAGEARGGARPGSK